MKKLILSIFLGSVLLFVGQNPLRAVEFKRTGTAGFTFMEIPATARQAALGDAYSALGGVNDASSIFINPAALGYVEGYAFNISYGTWFVETNHQAFSFAYGLGSAGAVGLSVLRFGAGDLIGTETDNTLQAGFRETGSFDFGAIAIGPSYAIRLTDRFSFGMTLRYVREGVSGINWADQGSEFNASNFLAEVGTLYYTGFGSLRFATNIQSIGFDTRYQADNFQAPVVYRLGAAYDFFDSPDSPVKLTTLLEAIHPTDATERMLVGAELWVKNMVALRGGYKFDFDEEGFTAGAGIQFNLGGNRPLGLDFAYVDYGRLEQVTRLSLNVSL